MAPSIFHAYIQLTRLNKFPLGTALVFWPAAFGVAMASYSFQTSAIDLTRRLVCFGVGCTLLHSTFCILNDIFDRDLDGLVERTKERPIVTGAVSLYGAWGLFFAFLVVTIYALSLANKTAVAFGLLSLPLHVLYPLTKRWTWWAQAWLGVSNGLSLFVGWFSTAGNGSSRDQTLAVLIMYGAIICWTIYFDTIYASQDRNDDARIGIFSTARLFESHLRIFASFLAVWVTVFLIYAGTLLGYGMVYQVISCGGAGCHLIWQLLNWNPDNNQSSARIFKSNNNIGLLVFLGMVADYAHKMYMGVQ